MPADRLLRQLLDERDLLLHFPYHSYDSILQFFNEAAIDPAVTSLQATFYRVAEDSRIANALVSAARNGKQVDVFMEVKARFNSRITCAGRRSWKPRARGCTTACPN